MEEKRETFNYTYSAKQQEEIRSIRKKYAAAEDDKMEQLRRMDRQVTQKAQGCSIALGVVGALLLGTGMSICMTDLSGFLGGGAMFVGIPMGLGGIVLTVLAYPVYCRVLRKERQRIAPEILRLTDELIR